MPIKVCVVEENGKQKVKSLRSGDAELTDVRIAPELKEVQKLANEALTDFASSVKAKDFTAFHAKFWSVFKREITKKSL